MSSFAPMFCPTSISAISIERISYAVETSKPLFKTVFEIMSGFSKTSVWVKAEPTVVTIPSPTRAKIVSSPAPLTRRGRFDLKVIFALTLSSIPSFAIAEIQPVSITTGVTHILTAFATSRPARSIAFAWSTERGSFALCAEINATITFSISPPAI